MLSFWEPTFDVALMPCCVCCPRLGRGTSLGRSGSIMKRVRLVRQDILLAWDYFIISWNLQKWDILTTTNSDHCLFPPQSPPSHLPSDGHGHFWNLAKGGGFELGFAEGIIRGSGSFQVPFCYFWMSQNAFQESSSCPVCWLYQCCDMRVQNQRSRLCLASWCEGIEGEIRFELCEANLKAHMCKKFDRAYLKFDNNP